MSLFIDRSEAGRQLAQRLTRYAGREDVIVLALPRGGVPVGHEVARALSAPLDVFLVRKLGVPGQEELAFGAIATGGIRVLNENVVRIAGISMDTIERIRREEACELERREVAYRGNRPELTVEGKIVILVDDGLATGASMRAASTAIKTRAPRRIVVAVPVAPRDACRLFEREVDELVYCEAPDIFFGVGAFYDDFSQLSDAEVRNLLGQAQMEFAAAHVK